MRPQASFGGLFTLRWEGHHHDVAEREVQEIPKKSYNLDESPDHKHLMNGIFNVLWEKKIQKAHPTQPESVSDRQIEQPHKYSLNIV